MNPIDFQCQLSKVKVTMGLEIFRQKILVNSIETSNPPQMFPMGSDWTLLISRSNVKVTVDFGLKFLRTP